jgi:hypothetical protein
MKRSLWFCLLLLGVSAVSFAGDLQVFRPPELRVFLDGELMGTSSERDDGLFLMNVPYGTRTIRVEKDGFVPQSIQVEGSNFPIEVRVGELSPEPIVRYMKEAEAVIQLVGNLVVNSAPQNCGVEIDGKPTDKRTPQLSIGVSPRASTRFPSASRDTIPFLVWSISERAQRSLCGETSRTGKPKPCTRGRDLCA